MRLLNTLMIAAVACVCLVGCSRSKASANKDLKTPKPEVQVTGTALEMSASKDFIAKFQPDVRLTARWEDGKVWVAISNESDKTFEVTPGDFAVILAGKKVVPVSPETATAQFPITTLAPRAAASGVVKFKGLGDLTGRPFVFSNPAVRPSRCIIKQGDAPAAAPSPAAEEPRDATPSKEK